MKIKLNLIPPQKKEEIIRANHFRLFLKWGIELFGIFAIFIVMLMSIYYILNINLRLAKESYTTSIRSNEQYKEIEKYESEINNVNGNISQIEKLQNGQLNWSKFFQRFHDHFSNEIEIKGLATRNYSVALIGAAKTRDNLISFKDSLAADSCFSEVNLPLSNLVSKEDLDFQIDFKIKQECLK